MWWTQRAERRRAIRHSRLEARAAEDWDDADVRRCAAVVSESAARLQKRQGRTLSDTVGMQPLFLRFGERAQASGSFRRTEWIEWQPL
jgi:hypothetical protein